MLVASRLTGVFRSSSCHSPIVVQILPVKLKNIYISWNILPYSLINNFSSSSLYPPLSLVSIHPEPLSYWRKLGVRADGTGPQLSTSNSLDSSTYTSCFDQSATYWHNPEKERMCVAVPGAAFPPDDCLSLYLFLMQLTPSLKLPETAPSFTAVFFL